MAFPQIANEDWIDFLHQNNIVETEEEKSKREEVLTLLQATLSNFIRAVIQSNSIRKAEPSCRLIPFGSYGLGGYTRNADMDLVLICSGLVKRSNFFQIFPDLLRHIPTCRDVETIRRATVPIIKCTIDSISIDISFVRLKESVITQDINLLNDAYLHGIDDLCVASMDGPRVNQYIKSKIRKEHIPLFQRSLQIIKHWATQRQIYSKPMGFLNGSSWTLLLLKTYLLEINHELTIYSLIVAFFKTWRDWPWPTPVMFTDGIPGKDGVKLNYQSLSDFKDAVMPIVSPCYPVCNSAPYVSKLTLKTMSREFDRALSILQFDKPANILLTKLFKPIQIFKNYNHFITMIVSSTSSQSFDVWSRKIAYNISYLISLLGSNPDIDLAQPILKPYTTIKEYQTLEDKRAFEEGYSSEGVRLMEKIGQFHPGSIYLIYGVVALKPKVLNCTVDISSQIDSYIKHLNKGRNKNDNDVEWVIKNFSKRETAQLLDIETQ